MDIRDATAIQKGGTPVSGVYVGSQEIWTPGGGSLQVPAAHFIGNPQYMRSPTIAMGGANPNGATAFEVQMLIYIEGARATQNRVCMVQFPASRQAGLYCTNTGAFELAVGDSQAGQVGGNLAAQPASGAWYFVTFSADNAVTPTGQWRGTCQSLNDNSLPLTFGAHAKGVESSLQAERIDLNGGGVDFGFVNGVRYAEVRAYNAQRSDAARQVDIFRKVPAGGEIFWWRFKDAGAGALGADDLTGNNVLPVNTGGTLLTGANGPTIP